MTQMIPATADQKISELATKEGCSTRLIFIGERRSPAAARMNVRWQDARGAIRARSAYQAHVAAVLGQRCTSVPRAGKAA